MKPGTGKTSKRLQQSVLLGLAAGMAAGVATSGVASAQTLTEYKAWLAEVNAKADATAGSVVADGATADRQIYLNADSKVTDVQAKNGGSVKVSVVPTMTSDGEASSDKASVSGVTFTTTNNESDPSRFYDYDSYGAYSGDTDAKINIQVGTDAWGKGQIIYCC